MFGSTILDLTFGLIFTFLIISLVTSTATEAFASMLSWRANVLLQGVKDLLNDPQFSGLALSIYNHGLANSQADGAAAAETPPETIPSYIAPTQFACALIDVVGLLPGTSVPGMQAKIDELVPDKQLNTVLNGIVVRAGGDMDRVRNDIAAWFDNGMNRVSGVYKRKTQLWSFVIALALAIALNIDAVKISHALWNQPMVLKGITPQLGETAEAALGQLQSLGLPFGWDNTAFAYIQTNPNWLYAIVGWLITALATLFGAPFWFDTLQRFVQLRGAGAK
jgi:hypothetical protein